MKRIYILILLIGIISLTNYVASAKELPLPESNYSLLTSQNEKKPIEINMNLIIDGDNSILDIGVVCNKTLGKQTLYANIIKYDFKTNDGSANWLGNYIQTKWDPAKAYLSFPSIDGMTIDCKEGAIYHFEYKFKWIWESTFNSICALAYVQNTESKEVFAVERSQNVLYSVVKPIIPETRLTVTAAKEFVYQYIISNPTQEKITYEATATSNNLLWEVSLDREIFVLSPSDYDTITLRLKTTPREQYGTITLSVFPTFLKDLYSVPETIAITHNVITDGIEFLAITNDEIPDEYRSGFPVWYSYLRNGCFAQPVTGNKWVFMQYNYWKSTYPDLDYKLLYLFPKSGDIISFGLDNTLEKAAMECIDAGKNLIVHSNCGLSLNAGKFAAQNLLPSQNATDFYKKLGIQYRGYINLRVPIEGTIDPVEYKNDTLSVRVEDDHELNQDIDETNTFVNSGLTLSSRVDYIGITGDNEKTFPFLWYNRKNAPDDSYAGVATVIGNSKIIYLSAGLETISGVADTLLIRNFMNWMLDPTAVTDTKLMSDINLYPNPADKYIDMSFINPGINSGIDNKNEMQIFNSLGENVTALVTRQSNRIFIENLSVGSYYCLIRTSDKTICKPFIVKR